MADHPRHRYVIDLLTGYFSEELIKERPEMRSSLHTGGFDGAEVRAEFADLLRTRTMSHDDFWRATSAWFDSDEDLYRELAEAYRFFFDEEPPASATVR